MRAGTFSTANNLLEIREEICDRQNIQDNDNDSKLKGIVNYIKSPDRSLILRVKKYRLLDDRMG